MNKPRQLKTTDDRRYFPSLCPKGQKKSEKFRCITYNAKENPKAGSPYQPMEVSTEAEIRRYFPSPSPSLPLS